MTTNDLLHELLSELAPPTLLIGSDRRLHFVSPAFRRLAAMDIEGMPCDVLLHPANFALSTDHCCWSVLDIYLGSGESGLWQLRGGQNVLRPVLCEMRAIGVDGRSAMIAILVRPVNGLVSPVALSFLRSLRRSVASVEMYEKNTVTYLRKHYGIDIAIWTGFSRDDTTAAESLLMEKLNHAIAAVDPRILHNELFDIIVEMDGRKRVFHVFQSQQSVQQTRLVISDTGGQLGDELISALRAAVVVWTEPADLSAPGSRTVSSAMIELLSATEREILGYLRQGMCDKEIASLRRVSVNTVRNQVSAVMHKVGVNKRSRLVAFDLAAIHETVEPCSPQRYHVSGASATTPSNCTAP